MQYDLSEPKKKCDLKETTFIMVQCRTTNPIFDKIGTEELISICN